MTDVFISYKREDEARVVPLIEGLRSAGLSVWWDHDTPAGQSWRGTTSEQLETARCVVVVWSERSIGPAAQFVHDEAKRAQARGVLLPVRIDRVTAPLGFGEIQSLDLVGWYGDVRDPRFQGLVAAANAFVAGEPRPRPRAERAGETPPRWKRWAAAGLVCLLIGVSWFLWPAPWRHTFFHASVLVLPFEPPPALAGERRTADEIGEKLAHHLEQRAGLQPVQPEISRLLASTQALPSTPCLPAATLRQLRRLTGADLVARGTFDVFQDRQPRKIVGCLQNAVDRRTITSFAQELARPEDLDLALAEMADLARSKLGPPRPFATVQRYSRDDEALRLYLSGSEHFQRYELKEARADLEAALKQDDGFGLARIELSRLLQTLGEDGAAQDQARRALTQMKPVADLDEQQTALLLRAHVLTTLGQWERAIRLYQIAWGQAPENGEAVARLVETQNLAGRSDRALATLRRARELQTRRRLALTPEVDAALDVEEATAYFWLGRADRQREAAHRAVVKLVQLPQPRVLLEALAKHRECDARIKLEQDWTDTCREARNRFAGSGDRIDAAKFDQLLAGWLADRGGKDDEQRALGLDRQVLSVFRDEGFTRGTIDQMTNLSNTLSDRGQDAEAKELCREVLQLAREKRSLNLPRVLTTCAFLPAMERDFAKAKSMYTEAFDIASRRGDLAAQAALLGDLAYMNHALGDRSTALRSYEGSLRLSREILDLGWGYGETLVRFARLLVDLHREPEAQENLAAAWGCYLTGPRRSEIPSLVQSIGKVLGGEPEPWRRLVARELSERSPRDRVCPPRGAGAPRAEDESEL